MKKRDIVLKIKDKMKEVDVLLSELIEGELPLMSSYFMIPSNDVKVNFFPTPVLEKFFGNKYPKRKIGSALLKEGFKRSVDYAGRSRQNGYYLVPISTKHWIELDKIKTEMYGN